MNSLLRYQFRLSVHLCSFVVLLLILLTGTARFAIASGENASASPTQDAKHEQALANFANSPLSFEANEQADSAVKFSAGGNGYSLFLTPASALFVVASGHLGSSCGDVAAKRSAAGGGAQATSTFRIEWVGADSAPQFAGSDLLPGRANHFAGNDPQKWRSNESLYGKVRQRAVYPGIDLVYYGSRSQLEYDFVVAAGAEPGVIRMRFHGADRVAITDDGDLLLTTAAGEIRQTKPFIYQEAGGRKTGIDGRYLLLGNHEVGFKIGAYDTSKTLVIDPLLQFLAIDRNCGAVAIDSTGNIFVTGVTPSTDFPVKSAFDTLLNNNGAAGNVDIFVTKINPAASGTASLVYSTYLGGSGNESSSGITVDSTGKIFVTGVTSSNDFPVTASAFDNLLNINGETGSTDVFVAELNPAVSGPASLVYSTYLGGGGNDSSSGIAIDSTGKIFITGETASHDFPVSSAAFDNLLNNNGQLGPVDAFVSKLDTTKIGAAQLVYSTYLGGNDNDSTSGIAIDSSGKIFVSGETASKDFPVSPAAFDKLLNINGEAGQDAFVVNLDPAASGLAQVAYSTFLGGRADDAATGIAVDATGKIFVTGITASPDFPLSAAPFDRLLNNGGETGPVDAFVSELDPAASGSAQIVYSTYLGGNADDGASGIALDSTGKILVTGITASNNFPVSSAAFDKLLNNNGELGPLDVFVTRLDPAASGSAQISYSTYLGGKGDESSSGIAVDSTGKIIIAGVTSSNDLPVSSGAFDKLLNNNGELGPLDVFVTTLDPAASGSAQVAYSTYLGGSGNETCFIAPSIAAFAPQSGPTGTAVTVTGANFFRASSVMFGSTSAHFTLSSGGTITATVPDGAVSSPIQVATPVGTATTSTAFTVTPPAVSILANIPNAQEGGATGQFTVSRTGSTTNALTVSYAISGTAVNGTDYSTLSGSVAIPATKASATINIAPVDDSLSEDPETVILQLNAGTSYVVNSQASTATVQIADNDPAPLLTINNVSVLEGGTAVFTVTLTPVSGRTVSVNFAAANGTAHNGLVCTAGTDYLPAGGTVTFAPGTTSQPVSVRTCGDTITEGNETFLVNLSNPVNAKFASRTAATATGTIVEGPGKSGTFVLTPSDAVVGVNDRLNYAVTWTVPDGRNWHDLKNVDLRIRHGNLIILWARFNEADNTFSVFHPLAGTFGRGVSPGSAELLETAQATLHMADTSVLGSGPTGPSVTLTFSLSFKLLAVGRDYVVELAAADDFGDQDDFVPAGRLRVVLASKD